MTHLKNNLSNYPKRFCTKFLAFMIIVLFNSYSTTVLSSPFSQILEDERASLTPQNETKFLPVKLAFPYQVRVSPTESEHSFLLEFLWDIQKGYYLYQNKFSLKTLSADQNNVPNLGTLSISPPIFSSEPEVKYDPNFERDMALFHREVRVSFLVRSIPQMKSQDHSNPSPKTTDLGTDSIITFQLNYQGCAEAGLCYPPQKELISIKYQNQEFGLNRK